MTEKKSIIESTIKSAVKNIWMPAVYGISIGVAAGILTAVFGRVLLAAGDFRDLHPVWRLPFLAPAGLLIVFVYEKYGKQSQKGMGLVFRAGHGEREKIPMRLIPLVMAATWITHLFGGSAGREGVAVQIGAALGQKSADFLPQRLKPERADRLFLIAGMAAGFAGLFRTPAAAVLFAMEVLVVGKLQYQALLPAVTAAFTASMVSGFLGLEKFTVNLTGAVTVNAANLCKLIAAGILFGLAGKLFAVSLSFAKNKLAACFPNPYLRIGITGVFLTVSLLLFWQGRYSGLGTNLIQASFFGEEIYGADWTLKLVFTVVTLAAGFQGGEVTPLFSIGASLGIVLAGILGLPAAFTAALGYAAVFGSATGTFLAPVLIGAEVFGYEYLPFFFLVCAFARAAGGKSSIYPLQKRCPFSEDSGIIPE